MNGFTLPDAPTLERTHSEQAVAPTPMKTDTGDGSDFVPRTLRVVAFVVAVGALLIAGARQYGLVVPFLTGAGLGAVLLAGFEFVVRRSFAAETILAEKGVSTPGTEDSGKKFGGKAAILLFALIKYPAVALLIWWIARHWSQTQIVVFASGFVLLQLIIGLRGLGAFLFPRTARK